MTHLGMMGGWYGDMSQKCFCFLGVTIFTYFHHPFWGGFRVFPLFLETSKSVKKDGGLEKIP